GPVEDSRRWRRYMITQLIGRAQDVLGTLSSFIGTMGGIQRDARKGMLEHLTRICASYEDAYRFIYERLVPVKAAYGDPDRLAYELRAFAADSECREKFGHSHLCGEITGLIDQLDNQLDPTRYSIAIGRLGQLRESLHEFGRFDGSMSIAYEEFARELDEIASQISLALPDDKMELSRMAKAIVDDFASRVFQSTQQIQQMKTEAMTLAAGQ
ncbi:MAG: hypothetical protein KDA28_03865, partial [Phycisphaerales bacterium]|nr:hypothetical protein [Phycisphaerales bacterium]